MTIDKNINNLEGIKTLLWFIFLGLFGAIFFGYIRTWDFSILVESVIGVLLLILCVTFVSYLSRSIKQAQEGLKELKDIKSKTSE